MDINIKVKDKIAVGDETLIVCGNSDYTVVWDLDDEWTPCLLYTSPSPRDS